MFSVASCVGLFALESLYILLLYDPHRTNTQAGLMLIFALEASYLLKISQANLEEKRALSRISRITRIYTAISAVPLLGLIAIATGLLPFGQYLWVWIALFLISACGKIAWERNRDRLGPLTTQELRSSG